MTTVLSAAAGWTVGLDVSDRYTQLCGLDADGLVVVEARLTSRGSARPLRAGATPSQFTDGPEPRVSLAPAHRSECEW
jgi:hypothetical protein